MADSSAITGTVSTFTTTRATGSSNPESLAVCLATLVMEQTPEGGWRAQMLETCDRDGRHTVIEYREALTMQTIGYSIEHSGEDWYVDVGREPAKVMEEDL